MQSVQFGNYKLSILTYHKREIVVDLTNHEDPSFEYHKAFKTPFSIEDLLSDFAQKGLPSHTAEWLSFRAKEIVADLTAK